MVLTRAAYHEIVRLRRASMLLERDARSRGARVSPRLAMRRFSSVASKRVARFNRKIAKYSFCQLIGDMTPIASLDRILSLALNDIDIVAANPVLRSGIHQAVRVARLVSPMDVGRVNRRWHVVKSNMRKSSVFSY